MTSFVDLLFVNEPGHMHSLASPMPHRYLLGPVFYGSPEATFHPEVLKRFLKLYLQRWLRIESSGDLKREKELFDRGVDTLDMPVWPDGLVGTDNLHNLASVFTPDEVSVAGEAEIRVGLTRTIFRLRRYGAYLGIRVVDKDGNDYSNAVITQVLESFTKPERIGGSTLVPFCHCISLTLPCFFIQEGRDLVFDAVSEMETMRRFVPTCEWMDAKGIAPMLIRDFLTPNQEDLASQGQDGVCVAKYGPMSIWIRIRTRNQTDVVRRRGIILEGSDTRIKFDRYGIDDCQFEYFVRTQLAPHLRSRVDHDIDYENEQRLLWEVARKLYAGLYDRDYESRVRMDRYALKLRYSEQLGQKVVA